MNFSLMDGLPTFRMAKEGGKEEEEEEEEEGASAIFSALGPPVADPCWASALAPDPITGRPTPPREDEGLSAADRSSAVAAAAAAASANTILVVTATVPIRLKPLPCATRSTFTCLAAGKR
jgi:hypothetical protein